MGYRPELKRTVLLNAFGTELKGGNPNMDYEWQGTNASGADYQPTSGPGYKDIEYWNCQPSDAVEGDVELVTSASGYRLYQYRSSAWVASTNQFTVAYPPIWKISKQLVTTGGPGYVCQNTSNVATDITAGYDINDNGEYAEVRIFKQGTENF